LRNAFFSQGSDLLEVFEGSAGLLFVYPGDGEAHVDENEIAGLYFGGEGEVDCFADTAEVYAAGAKGGIFTENVYYSAGYSKAHRKLVPFGGRAGNVQVSNQFGWSGVKWLFYWGCVRLASADREIAVRGLAQHGAGDAQLRCVRNLYISAAA
jgi:hypothetical protein